MPVLWSVSEGIVFLSLIGDFEFHEIQFATVGAYADPATPSGAPLLVDGRSSLAQLSLKEAERRGAWFGDLLQRGLASRCALVVGASEYRQRILAEGIATQEQAGLPLRSFTNFADAMTWLKAPKR
jgi:hypothetical protein